MSVKIATPEAIPVSDAPAPAAAALPADVKSEGKFADSERVAVVGAGLVGCMMALMLARRNIPVRLIELREDIRSHDRQDDATGRVGNSLKRSINLALSYRGLCALDHVKLRKSVEKILIPMKGRYIHNVEGKVNYQPYGVGDQAIYSVSRADLNKLLLDELDNLPSGLVVTSFCERVRGIEKDGTLITERTDEKKNKIESRTMFKTIVGADGAFSAVRGALNRLTRFDFSQEQFPCCYKELTIPPKNGDWALKPHEGLHIWARHKFMMIALPNPDKTFTCTLFAPLEGEFGLNNLTNQAAILNYFQQHFKDVIGVMPDFISQFDSSPTSPLVTIRCKPWYYKDKVVIMGDAAHAVTPFYGQGMNSGFEDALLFDELLEANGMDFGKTIQAFGDLRQPQTDGLADLSKNNFTEMASQTASATFLMKKQFESILYRISPSLWTPLYTMVSFTRTPFNVAVERSKKQDTALYWTLSAVGLAALAGGAYAWFKGTSSSPTPAPK